MANIPPKRNRKEAICFSPHLYRARNLVERFFNKHKQCRRIATRLTRLQPTISRSSSWHQSGYGCALMSRVLIPGAARKAARKSYDLTLLGTSATQLNAPGGDFTPILAAAK